MLMPATGVLIGTPASMSASTPPQTEVMLVEPFDSHTSLLMRMASHAQFAGRLTRKTFPPSEAVSRIT